MKHLVWFTLLCAGFIFMACETQAGDKPGFNDIIQEEYSLEWKDDSLWQIDHDSEFYNYFNKIHRTYNLLLKDVQDPEEKRRLFIERDLKIAKKRLDYMADKNLVDEVIGGTYRTQGTNPTGHLFRMDDVYHVPRQKFTPDDPSSYTFEKQDPMFGSKGVDAMTAIIHFDRQMKRRGVKLIVVPVPNSSQLHAHKLNEKIQLEEVIWHPWAHMIVKLLEYDVEVLDLLDLYKAYNGDNTTINYIDHHWGQAGLDIVGRELAQRLERFSFDEKYYIDPTQLSRKEIVVDTPALIPHWDDITVSYIESKMPYSPTYKRDQILYKNSYIRPAKSFEDSPVLIMGDSFIFHAEETSSGIYSHLAYYTHIIPAQFSRNAGAAAPPSFYKRFVAGKGKEPEVVIWEIYGSAFNSITNLNNWHIIDLPEPENPVEVTERQQSSSSESGGSLQIVTGERPVHWVEGKVAAVTTIPETENTSYPDALYAFQLSITDPGSSSLDRDQTVLVYKQYMKEYAIDKNAVVMPGETYGFYLEEWTSAADHSNEIATMQTIDDLGDFESDLYFCHLSGTLPNDELKKLQKETISDQNSIGIAFSLNGIHLVESTGLALSSQYSNDLPIFVETSLDGIKWFRIYSLKSDTDGPGVKVFSFEYPHPAAYIRFTGNDIERDIDYSSPLSGTGSFSGIEIYGY